LAAFAAHPPLSSVKKFIDEYPEAPAAIVCAFYYLLARLRLG
jgi:hypothetical protein